MYYLNFFIGFGNDITESRGSNNDITIEKPKYFAMLFWKDLVYTGNYGLYDLQKIFTGRLWWVSVAVALG